MPLKEMGRSAAKAVCMSGTVKRSYARVLERVENAAAALGAEVETLTEADGYPLVALETGRPTGPRLLTAAGIHGEEPAAVEGLLRWLESHAAPWLDRLRLVAFPCLNPWGYERGIRYVADGADLNRQFKDDRYPAVNAVKRRLSGLRFDLFMDLHEDCDFEKFYMYEISAGSFAGTELGERILKIAEERVGLSDGEDIGGLITRRGRAAAGDGEEGGPPDHRARFEKRPKWPIAFYALMHHTDHTITLETPGLLAEDERADVHAAALEEACRWLTGRGGGPSGR